MLLDDLFVDGLRNNTSLPTDAAWFASSSGSLTAAPGAMTLAMGGSAILGVSYFTTNASSPVVLGVGETLLTTIRYTFNGVAPLNSSQGFRVAVCNFGSNRASADFSSSSSQGANVQAYGLFQTMGVGFNNTTPMDLRKRTNLSSSSLLGTSGDWTSLNTGPGNTNSFSGFMNSTQYVLQMALQRTGTDSMQVSATWANTVNGTTLSTSTFDTGATNFNFDGVAIRPQTAATSSTNIVFNEVRVELIPAGTAPLINTQPQDQTVFTGQTATFSVIASGTGPLTYQWYYNENTLLTNATSSSLTITNAQPSDIGGYSVIVSNAFGSAISDTAELTVSAATAPSIVNQPQSLTVLPGQSAVFTVTAGGSAPFSYQWYYNTNSLLANATSDTLTLSNVQPGAAGTYSVVVTNLIGFTNSDYAILTVNTNPVAPSFTSQPVSQIVLTGGTATFNATAVGTATISYQWNKNGLPVVNATSATLTLTNVQPAAAGSYTLTASNNVGGAVSSAAILTVTPSIPVPDSDYNLVGFGRNTTGGGVIPETDPAYAKVSTPLELANAVIAFNKTGSVKVIEIMNDLDLGWNEIGPAVQNLTSTPFTSAATPLLHPRLLTTGVSKLDIKYKNGGLTIFSTNGATIRHCTFNIKSTYNIIVRNLKFDEMWEWDESSRGNYDKNDWDFIDLANGGSVYNIWIDHCTFTKSYDGIVDLKAGSTNVTFSWCKYTGDDGATNPNSFVWQQINTLESNKTAYAFYNFLRNNGFSTTNIVQIIQGHDKTHLMGSNSQDPNNANLSATFHHLWMQNCWDRAVPRLRAGNVHDFNIYLDDTDALAARRLRNAIAATMSGANQSTLNNTYSFNPPLNGGISTEGGAVLVEKSVYVNCLYPLRNNQTDPSNPIYTGKILGLDMIYQMDNTVFRGNSTNAASPLGPFQAPVIPFSWNPGSGAPGGQLPYSYTPDDPAQLQSIVTSPTAGAGAGVLTWFKTNWLVTTYAATAPFIVVQPQNVTVTPGQSATFSVFAGGSASLRYQWYFNTNTPVLNATNAVLTLPVVMATNAGVYSVIITNLAGSTTSTNVLLLVSGVTPATPQVSGLIYHNGLFSLTVDGDSGHDCIIEASTNLIDWTGIFTNVMTGLPFTWSDPASSNFNRRYYRILIPD